jgi:hypothetical protein
MKATETPREETMRSCTQKSQLQLAFDVYQDAGHSLGKWSFAFYHDAGMLQSYGSPKLSLLDMSNRLQFRFWNLQV